MRTFLDVLRFELRLQCRSVLFAGVLALFFLIHALTIAQTGIHLTDNGQIQFNSPYLVFQTQLVLGLFGLLPALIFVVQSIVRDYERTTLELIYTTPVGRVPWLLGRFWGGALCALAAAVAGLLGSMAGTALPWVDPARVAPFAPATYLAAFGALTLPNTLVFCALAFAVAARTRSQAWTFAVALTVVVGEVILNNATAESAGPAWLSLTDPLGGLPLREVSRYWTVAELNSRLPVSPTLLLNRGLWLAVGAGALGATLAGTRLALADRRPAIMRRRGTRAADPRPVAPTAPDAPRAGFATVVTALLSQWRTDLRAVITTPLFGLVALFTVVDTVSEFQSNRDLLIGLPLHPLTGLMLDFFRLGLFQFVLLILVYYSATLVFREHEHGLAEIVGATPCPDWVLPVSKTLTLMVAVSLVLATSMATSIVLQLAAGHTNLELSVYLQGLFAYNGTYFFMLCVLAVAVQACSPGKWTGMMLLAAVLIGLLSLEELGFEHVLYGFRIPRVVYSDMNGFGHYQAPALWLIAYWAPVCVLLLVAASLLFPRGPLHPLAERVARARARLTPGLVRLGLAMALAWAVIGGWIFWNTNVLNTYETARSRRDTQAAYERQYGAWKHKDSPALSAISVQVELYPEDRRLDATGEATLINRKAGPIAEIVLSTDPRLRIDRLQVERGQPVGEDARLGVRTMRLEPPLQPGEQIRMQWQGGITNRGFPNSAPPGDIVVNGTFVDLSNVMPLPAYDVEREITDPGERRAAGLPDAPPLPRLGDPAWLNSLGMGVDGRTDIRIVFGTSADQTAVAPGVLTRSWEREGRRYFEYVMERPVWPQAALASARYAVARDSWNNVSLEVYHHPTHAWNVPVMLDTAKKALAYFSREYAPYPLSHFRVMEYPRYRTAARAFAGGVAYSESAGFLTDLRTWAPLDYTTIHELAHQWWGGLVYGARMQGRQVLNETMAQYSTFMIFREYEDPQWLHRIMAATLDNYLRLRSADPSPEQPLMFTEDQGNISYNKGALVMFALQDLLGPERMHLALRHFLATFAFKGPPFPTSRDLVAEIRAVAGPEHQALITDLFERIVLYDVKVEDAEVRPAGSGFEVTLRVAARKFESTGAGVETERPLEAPFVVAAFAGHDRDLVAQAPLVQERHTLRSGTQVITLRTSRRPGVVAVDPFHLMIDRTPSDNVHVIPE
ncbi:MAG: M1 family aminopeptidase [Vicinamibacterales bacterium]